MATHSSVLAGESQGQGSPVGCRLWGRTGLDTTEVTQQLSSIQCRGTPIQYSALTPREKDLKQSGYKYMYNRFTLMNA